MRIDINMQDLLDAYGVHIAGTGERHYRHGWLSMPCPFCSGGVGNHMGYSLKSKVFTCWRCGKHTVGEVLARIMNMPKGEAVRLAMQRYPGNGIQLPEITFERPTDIRIPGSRTPSDIHIEYLMDRNLDAMQLADEYDCKFTIDEYPKNRVVFPVIHQGMAVSYVARAVDDNPLRYLVCKDKLEVRKAKHCLWGANRVGGGTIIVVEGIFDALRIGVGAVAVLGMAWTMEQAREIAKYKQSYIMFDNTDEAQDAGRKLAETVTSLGGNSKRVRVAEFKDPGEFTDEMVEKVRNTLLNP